MIFAVACAVFPILFFIIFKLIEKPLTASYCERLLKDKKNYGSSLPARLACAIIPSRRIFRSLSLPIPGKDGEEIQLGTVIVTKAGVFILCQINGSGILENPTDSKWKHISSGKFTEFANPFLNQKDARTLIEYYASSYAGDDINAYSIVLYTDPSLKFTHQKPRGIISAKEFPARLSKMEKTGKLSQEQIRAVCKMFSEIQAY